jgi:uncharacterized repeat protein (TIGR03803 family)
MSSISRRLSLVLLVTALQYPAWAASKYQVLYSFRGGNDGAYPVGTLIFDKSGNLYGTTYAGGGSANCPNEYYGGGCGTAFQLTRGKKRWRESILHAFQNGTDGAQPNGGLAFDSAGTLYGSTQQGGEADSYNCGTIFSLTSGSAGWTENVIYTFCSREEDGYFPGGGLIADQAGNLYGTTISGGSTLGGIAFELSQNSGQWTATTLWNFCLINCFREGSNPVDTLVWDAEGNLYGTTPMGGDWEGYCGGFPGGCGVVFELRQTGGVWKEKVLHSFRGPRGGQPSANIAFDKKGNIYGTTGAGGAFGYGTVFEMSPVSRGGWRYSVLYNFHTGDATGLYNTGVVVDEVGNLYGASTFGGGGPCGSSGCGRVYRLTPSKHGRWKYSVLHQFTGNTDGGEPDGDLIFGPDGRLYGVASVAGRGYSGVVFAMAP